MKNNEKWKMKKFSEKQKSKSPKISLVFWLHTQNPWRFLGFAVVVFVTFFSMKSLCLFPEEKQQNILGFVVFPRKSDNRYWTWNKNTHFTDENQRHNFAKVGPSHNNYSSRIVNRSTTTTTATVRSLSRRCASPARRFVGSPHPQRSFCFRWWPGRHRSSLEIGRARQRVSVLLNDWHLIFEKTASCNLERKVLGIQSSDTHLGSCDHSTTVLITFLSDWWGAARQKCCGRVVEVLLILAPPSSDRTVSHSKVMQS